MLTVVAALLTQSAFGNFASTPVSGNARATVIGLFKGHDVVCIPERHGDKVVHDFLRDLITDTALADAGVRDTVRKSEIQKAWRDTTQFLVWDSPVYESFFRMVRDVNCKIPAKKRLRVLLGDPPIEWERVRTKEDYLKFGDRDLSMASVVQREVLAKKRKALLIAGGMHLILERDPAEVMTDEYRSVGDLLRRRHGNQVFLFWYTTGPIQGQSGPGVHALALKGSALENSSFAPFAPEGFTIKKIVDGQTKWVPAEAKDWPKATLMTDGLIDYGQARKEVLAPPSVYKDAAYVKELHRRAAIMKSVFDIDFESWLKDAINGKG
jgi:hypothetical protein